MRRRTERLSIATSQRLLKIVLVAGTLAAAGSLAGCGGSSTGATPKSATFTALDAGKLVPPASGIGSGAPLAAARSETDGGTSSTKRSLRISEQFTAVSTPGNPGYRIGPQDTLEFAVFKVPDLHRTVVVAETGAMNLPLIGDVQASGRTASELERDVAARLGKKFLQHPQVTFIVREYSSQRITVDGAVKKPGVYPLRGRTTLLQVVAMAEGFTETGDATVVIFRQEGSKRLAAKFDVADIRSGAAADPVLHSGDTIVAPTSATKEVFASILKAVPLATFAALAL